MKKIFNFRPIFFAFIMLLCGIYLSTTILKINIYLNLALFILCFILLGLFFLIKFLRPYKFKATLLICTFLLSLVLGTTTILSYQKLTVLNNQYVEIEATLTDSIKNYEKNDTVVLRNVKINGKKYSGNLHLNIYNSHDQNGTHDRISAGDKVAFKALLGVNPLFKDDASINTRSLYLQQKFNASVQGKNLKLTDGKPNFFESIRLKTKYNLNKYISDPSIASACYTVLFGDKNYLSDDISQNFRLAGTAHLLAISGLHIGLLTAVLFFVLKLFKVKKTLKFIITASFLLIYCFLAGFSPSICRAALVICVYLFATLIGKRKDVLNALSFSGIVIILFNPFVCFNLSFILSYACVFAIITLIKPIKFAVSKIKFLSRTAVDAISITLAVNFALIFITSFYFKQVYLVSVFANLFLVPLFSVMFSVLFIFSLLGLIWSYLSCGLIVAGFLFHLTNSLAYIFSFVPSLVMHSTELVVILTFIVLFLISNFSFLKNKLKYILCSIFVLIAATVSVVYSLPRKGGAAYYKTAYGCDVLQTENNKTALFLTDFSRENLLYNLEQLRLDRFYKIDLLIILNSISEKETDNFISIFSAKGNNVPVYLCDTQNQKIMENLDKCAYVKTVTSFQQVVFNGYSFFTVVEDDAFLGLVFNSGTFNFLYVNDINELEVDFLNRYLLTENIKFVSTEVLTEPIKSINTNKIVARKSVGDKTYNSYVVSSKGSFVYK